MRRDVFIAPSILAADFARLGEEVRAIDAAGCDWVHIDVMDGHFVPNMTFGPKVVGDLRPLTRKPFDVHLMIAPCDPYLAAFADAGADIITIHAEVGPHVHRSLQTIRQLGKKTGLALNPATPAQVVLPVLDMLDLILVMTVNPGFGGQAFLPFMTAKVRQLRDMIGERPILLEVDGGITAENAHEVAAGGSDVLVAGSSIFAAAKSGSFNHGQAAEAYRVAISALRTAALPAPK